MFQDFTYVDLKVQLDKKANHHTINSGTVFVSRIKASLSIEQNLVVLSSE